jgi:hypothetical protein
MRYKTKGVEVEAVQFNVDDVSTGEPFLGLVMELIRELGVFPSYFVEDSTLCYVELLYPSGKRVRVDLTDWLVVVGTEVFVFDSVPFSVFFDVVKSVKK